MSKNDKVTRRTVVSGLAVAPALSTATMATELTSPDAQLLALGRELDAIATALDSASEHHEAAALLQRIDALTNAIVAMPATTFEGLHVKARATAWALEYDCGLLDPAKEISINNRVAASIVRDLLNLGVLDA